MSKHENLEKVSAAIRAALQREMPAEVQPHHSLVADLGFDSMSMALLGLALEDEFECPVLLNEWISLHGNPESLTVRSLCDYLNRAAA